MSKLSSNNLIPEEYLKPLVAVVKGTSTFNRDTGKWVQGKPTEINFKGAILPLSSRDLNQLQVTEGGIFSVDDKKLYTDQSFSNHTQIRDDTKVYEIYVVKDYGIFNSTFKEYYIKKIDKIDG